MTTPSTRPYSTSRGRLLLPALAALALCACVVAPRPDDYEQTWPENYAEMPREGGAIYQAGRDLALFENPVARRVGDIVTIRLQESTAAQKSSSTTTSKSTSVDIPGPTIGGRPVTVNGVPILETEIESDSAFDGAGDSKQSNRLQGDITVSVAKRLSNGYLLVRGQKWIGINQGKEYVRVEGVIRPIDIQPDNSIPSYKVANAVISYGGQGVVADASRMSWIARFFNSAWAPL